MGWFTKLLSSFLVIDRETLPTLEDAHLALSTGGSLSVEQLDESRSISGTDLEGNAVASANLQLRNAHLSILYYRTEFEGAVKESYDLLIEGKRGGLAVFFTNGQVDFWKRRDVRLSDMRDPEQGFARAILQAARDAS